MKPKVRSPADKPPPWKKEAVIPESLVAAFERVDLATREAFHAAYRYRHKIGVMDESESAEYSLPSLHAAFGNVFAGYRVSVPIADDAPREEIPENVARLLNDALRSLRTDAVEPLLRLARQMGRDPERLETLTEIVRDGLREYVIRRQDMNAVS